MPQLGSQTKQKKVKKPKTKVQVAPSEVVSAYSEEGEARQKRAKKRDIAIFSLVVVFLAAVVVLTILMSSGIF